MAQAIRRAYRVPLFCQSKAIVIKTFNAFHLGDNLVTLHFLRALARANPDRKFRHCCSSLYLPQLESVVNDLPNLNVAALDECADGVNTWCGTDGWWYRQTDTTDWAANYLRWLAIVADRLGFPCPFTQPRDLLFDYPALKSGAVPWGIKGILVVNSPPLSGQFAGFSSDGFDRIIRLLYNAGHTVVTTQPSLIEHVPCTQDHRLTITGIGRLSQQCRAIVGVATGPMWTTWNVWSDTTVDHRIILSDRERVDLSPNTAHANSLSLVPELLRERGLI